MTCGDARLLLSQQLDGVISSADVQRLGDHLRDCAACRALHSDLADEQQLLAAAWRPVAAPVGFGARVTTALPPRPASRTRSIFAIPRRRTLALGGALALALIVAGIALPPVRTGIDAFFRTVTLRETTEPPPEQRVGSPDVLTLEEAQQRVPWQIRTPAFLPEGYRLVAVLAGEAFSFADGPAIDLVYQRGDGPQAPQLRIVQLRAVDNAEEPVVEGAWTVVRVGDREGRLIDGSWEPRNGRMEWVSGTHLRLLLEDGDLVIWLDAYPQDGWDAAHLIAVAASLR
ncbi:MAG: anti-sigma factor family protein [Dehalococcoidia bacterium]